MSGLREVKATGMGVLGRPDPVAWQAMQDVMRMKMAHNNVRRNLSAARKSGNVVVSLALCRDQLRLESQGSEDIAVCRRVAGDAAALASVQFADGEEGRS